MSDHGIGPALDAMLAHGLADLNRLLPDEAPPAFTPTEDIVREELVGAAQRHSSVLEYAEALEARLTGGEADAELAEEARAARAAAAALERAA